MAIRWFVYLFGALCMCGIVPMAVAEGLIWFCDSFSCWWLVIVLFAAEIWLICRWIERDL